MLTVSQREDLKRDIAKMQEIADRLEASGWTRVASRIRREAKRRQGMLAGVGGFPGAAVARLEEKARARE